MNHKLNLWFFKKRLRERIIPDYERYVEECRKRGLIPLAFEEWAVPIPKDADALERYVLESWRRFVGRLYREVLNEKS